MGRVVERSAVEWVGCNRLFGGSAAADTSLRWLSSHLTNFAGAITGNTSVAPSVMAALIGRSVPTPVST